jgi:hypothetical protein
MTAHLTEADLRRIARGGFRPLSADDGLALLDAALGEPYPALAAVHFDPAALARQDALPPLLRGLVRTTAARPVATHTTFAQRLRGLPPADREQALLDLVRTEAAAVLASPTGPKPDQPLQELGLDSLMALELRNRLATATGVRLHATLLFDHPTPAALARFLQAEVLGDEPVAAAPGLVELDRLEAIVAAMASDDLHRATLATRLQVLASKLGTTPGAAVADVAEKLQSATDDELFDFYRKVRDGGSVAR